MTTTETDLFYDGTGKTPPKRVVRVDIDFAVVEGMFCAYPENEWLQCHAGLPEGAKLVGGKLEVEGWYGIRPKTLVLYFEHESFAEVPEHAEAPSFEPQFRRTRLR